MTSFGAFFRAGEDVLLSSNYDSFSALRTASFQSLRNNVIFYVLIIFWGSYGVCALTLAKVDRVQFRRQKMQSLASNATLDRSSHLAVQESYSTYDKESTSPQDSSPVSQESVRFYKIKTKL